MLEVGFKSDKGLRREKNEDAFFVIPEESIFMVADGVGGNNSGDIASRSTISKVVEYIRNNAPDKNITEDGVVDYFTDCLSKVNREIYELSLLSPENKGMATTITIAYITGGEAHIVNIGDSRAYHFRNGVLAQITEDHTYVNTLIKKGAITKEEAQHHEKKNIITRAIGGDITTLPDFFCIGIDEGDIILLCTDGLHGEIEDEGICGIIAEGGSMAETCSNLVNKANRRGGRDNITVVCLRV